MSVCQQIQTDRPEFELTRKKIKTIRITIEPPDAKIRVSAPMHLPLDSIQAFIESKAAWIKRQQEKILMQHWPAPFCYTEDELHPIWGSLCPLCLQTHGPYGLRQDRLMVKSADAAGSLQQIYREELIKKADPLITHWQQKMNVGLNGWQARKMTSRWGSCRFMKKQITLNTALAQYPPECLELVVVHELCHLIEPNHSKQFYQLLQHYLADCHLRASRLKQPPATK